MCSCCSEVCVSSSELYSGPHTRKLWIKVKGRRLSLVEITRLYVTLLGWELTDSGVIKSYCLNYCDWDKTFEVFLIHFIATKQSCLKLKVPPPPLRLRFQPCLRWNSPRSRRGTLVRTEWKAYFFHFQKKKVTLLLMSCGCNFVAAFEILVGNPSGQ